MYKYSWYHYLIITILVIFQPFISKWLQISNIKPDLLLIFFVLSILNKDKKHSLIIGMSLGFIYDLLYSHFFGHYMLILLIAIISVWGISKLASIENIFYISVFGLVITYFISFINAILELPIHEIISNFSYINSIAFYQSIYSGIIYLIISIIYYLVSIFKVNKVTNKKGVYNG